MWRNHWLSSWERCAAASLIGIVVGFSIYWLLDFQGHLHRTRLVIDRYDTDARGRGLEIVYGMVGVLLLIANRPYCDVRGRHSAHTVKLA